MKISRLPSIEKRPFSTIEESREAVVLTTQVAWEYAKLKALNVRRRVAVEGNSKSDMDALAAACEGEVVYGIGGGLVIDTAKYVAAAKGLPLVVLPTLLSTDAFLTDTTGVRGFEKYDGCVHYLPTKAPDTVIVDIEVLCNAPANMRASGAADVLSIATAMWDWEESEKLNLNAPTERITPQTFEIGGALLQTLLDNVREIGAGTAEGLSLLLDLLCLEVQLCYLCGHSRVEEGSEHYFVYALENRLKVPVLHGELVGLGILLMAVLQSQPWLQYRHALECLGINYCPLGVPVDAIMETLINLPAYVVHHDLPYSVASTLQITPEIAARTLETVLN